MIKDITIRRADNSFREGIVSLLLGEKLPTEDLPANLDKFIIALDGDWLTGVIGIEQFSNCGLLRSLAVKPAYRNRQVAAKLIEELEIAAFESGIECIYLLTETAPKYFEKKGFETIAREEVPEALKMSSEFSYVCPVSAIVMKKVINNK